MKSYQLSNGFYDLSLENETDINVLKLKKYFFNYINIEEKNNNDENENILVIRDKEKYNKENFEIEYIIDEHKVCIENNKIVIFLDNTEKDTIFLKRFIIDYMNRIIEKNGGMFLHGSTIINKNDAIIFTGKKMSGKTTNMLFMLEKEGFNYSSNEKVALVKRKNKIYSYGCPSNINIRVGTIKYNANILKKLKMYIDTKEYEESLIKPSNSKEERIVFTASELSNSFDTNIEPIGIVKCICNLTFLPEVDFSMRELSYKEKLIILKRNIISGVYPTREEILNKIVTNDYSGKIEDLTDIKCYNICHNNTVNNTEKILTRIKEDL